MTHSGNHYRHPIAALSLVACVALTGCGRIGFNSIGDADAQQDARGDGPTADAACVPTGGPELCNTIDDDCDGEFDEGLTVTDDPASCGGFALEGSTTISGQSWDRSWVVRFGRLIEGGPIPVTCCEHPLFGTGEPGLDLSRSVGVLLGTDGTDGVAHWGDLPAIGQTPGANIDRQSFELSWGDGVVLHNGPGADLAVYEISTVEAFAVQVRKTGAEWSERRYHFSGIFDATHGANITLFDLSSFGIAEGEWIDTLRIGNIFNSNAATGADRVSAMSGEGVVIRPGESGYDTAFPLLSSATGMEFTDDTLDADVIWIVALQPIVPVGCCVR